MDFDGFRRYRSSSSAVLNFQGAPAKRQKWSRSKTAQFKATTRCTQYPQVSAAMHEKEVQPCGLVHRAYVGSRRQIRDFGGRQVVTPRDSISSVKFGGRRDLVAATSWDNSASVFQYTRDQNKLSSQLLLQSQDHTLPVLSCCFSPDGDKLATASLDKTGRIWDLERNASNVLAQHEQGIKCINWVDSRALVVTGSWDRTLKYWPTNMNGAMATGECMVRRSETRDVILTS